MYCAWIVFLIIRMFFWGIKMLCVHSRQNIFLIIFKSITFEIKFLLL